MLNLLEKISEMHLGTFCEDHKLKLIMDLKSVTLKNWTHKFYSEVQYFL